jgi:hypothetical protein
MRAHYNSWRLLSKLIPRDDSKIVARVMGCVVSYVQKWRREPESDDAPTGTGYISPHDGEKLLIDALALINPDGIPELIADLQSHADKALQQIPQTPITRAMALARAARESGEGVAAFAMDLPPEMIRKEALEAIAAWQMVLQVIGPEKKVGGRKR